MTDDLTKQQLKAMSSTLDALKAAIESLLESTESGTEPVNLKNNQGRLSRMDELHNQSILLANRNVAKNRLRSVMQAKARLEDGSFGFCLDCEEPITIERLHAYPDAPRCIECQSDSEALR
ncbi:MAG: TraR/DksA family transcriptional regulator [Pseudomonadales bacterium]|nr:TraR/DksA family transcriptional regulator [Pseudomonadales bacterium]MBO6655623.1 TraR/DksA family transcriptional regulator [Pseudomonadales bacterium]